MAKVLLVDDDKQILDFLTQHFENHGDEVIQAEDGKAAVSMAGTEKPDLIVLDMNMPMKTGWEVAKELKLEGAPTSGIPIIALTVHKTADDHAEAHEAGCDAFVEKPIDPERLFETVDRILKQG